MKEKLKILWDNLGLVILIVFALAILDLLGLRPKVEGHEFSPAFIIGFILFLIFIFKKKN